MHAGLAVGWIWTTHERAGRFLTQAMEVFHEERKNMEGCNEVSGRGKGLKLWGLRGGVK